MPERCARSARQRGAPVILAILSFAVLAIAALHGFEERVK